MTKHNLTPKQYYFLVVLLLGVVIYYLMPLVFSSGVLTMGLLFIINPIYNIVAGLLYTVKFGAQVYIPIALGIAFLPTVFLYYEMSHFYLAILYATACFIAGCIGYPIHRRYHR